MKRKISINFTEEYVDVYNFLKAQANISNYICTTIKNEMFKSDEDYLDKKIRMIVQELLKNYQLDNTFVVESANLKQNSISEEDIDLINNLF